MESRMEEEYSLVIREITIGIPPNKHLEIKLISSKKKYCLFLFEFTFHHELVCK